MTDKDRNDAITCTLMILAGLSDIVIAAGMAGAAWLGLMGDLGMAFLMIMAVLALFGAGLAGYHFLKLRRLQQAGRV